MFNSTFNALPVMVCKHFPKMVLFEVRNAIFSLAEIYTQAYKKCIISEGKGCFSDGGVIEVNGYPIGMGSRLDEHL